MRASRLLLLLCAAAVLAACPAKKKKAPPPPPPEDVDEGAEGAGGDDPPGDPPPETPPPVQGKKPDLGPIINPADNPTTDDKVRLGHQLFFDARLSADGSRSCYSCHQNEHGNAGELPLAVGANEKQLTRHSPVIWNVAYLQAFYWDGRSPTLEAQAKAAWAGGNMGVGEDKLQEKTDEIAEIPGYKTQFQIAFPDEPITPDLILKALAAYERTLICDNTAWDRAQAGDATAMSEDQRRGQDLFMGKAGCIACHAPPHFSSAYGIAHGTYFNVGIGTQDKEEADIDVGRMAVTKTEADWAAFKPPTLRNVSKTAPYFHDGSVPTLVEAVKLMASGGVRNKNLSPILGDKQLTEDELNAIVAFLGALDCEKTLEPPPLP
jgi:cytochrome c peroxidase